MTAPAPPLSPPQKLAILRKAMRLIQRASVHLSAMQISVMLEMLEGPLTLTKIQKAARIHLDTSVYNAVSTLETKGYVQTERRTIEGQKGRSVLHAALTEKGVNVLLSIIPA